MESEKQVRTQAANGDDSARAESENCDSAGTPPSSLRLAAMKRGGIFFAFVACLCALVSLNYFRQIDVDFSGEGGIYALCTMFGHFAMLGLLGWAVFCLPWALAFPRRPLVPAAISIMGGGLGALVVVADTFVFGLYRYHVYNGFVLDLLFSTDAAGIFTFTAGQLALILLVVVVVFVAVALLGFVAKKVSPHCGKKSLCAGGGALLLLLAASHLMHMFFSATGSRSVYQIAEVYPGYFPLTANRFLIRHGFVDPEKVREKIRLSEGSALDYPRHPLVPAKPPEKNILVIFLDSWNVRTFAPEVMPNVCAFAKSAQVFTQHYSGDHGTRTGVISFFHGLPGLYFNTIRDGGVSSALIDFLVEQKYEMGIFATASLANPPFSRTVFASAPAGTLHYNYSNGVSVAEGDVKTADAWLDFTKKYTSVPAAERKPFFGFLFFDELHGMTLPADAEIKFPTDWTYPQYERLGKNTAAEPFFNLYKNDAYWLDAQLKRVFDDLRERGLLENTVVILTGDHGQEFNEDGNNTWGHGSAFSEHQLHVPFILFDASLEPKIYSHWTAHYDATVTLFQNYLHCENAASDYSVGKNLFDAETPREWLLVGHPEQFGVIEKDRITHVKYDRSYEIFDRNYRYLPDARLNVPVFQAALEQAREYFKKSAR